MRMLMRVSLSTEKANDAIRNATLQSTIQKILADVKPEAAYFMADDAGNRTGLIFLRHARLVADSRSGRTVVPSL